MKVVILAGGLGTRLMEETEVRPKPMVEIGGKPILWHIMQGYAHHGFREFIIALGYKGDYIKKWFLDYPRLSGSLTVDFASGAIQTYHSDCDDWVVHLIETGSDTQTGGRLKRVEHLLNNEPFMVTYGDGVSDVEIGRLVSFHFEQKKTATVTAVRPPARFGGLALDGNLVAQFTEKPQIGEGWINGGFMVCEPAILRHIQGDFVSLEADVLEPLANDRQLAAYRHPGFWQCMDTLRDKRLLESLWESQSAPWKVWQTKGTGKGEKNIAQRIDQ